MFDQRDGGRDRIGGVAVELGVGVEVLLRHHGTEHAVRAQHLGLGLHHGGLRVGDLPVGHDLVVEHPQASRVDQDLGRRGVRPRQHGRDSYTGRQHRQGHQQQRAPAAAQMREHVPDLGRDAFLDDLWPGRLFGRQGSLPPVGSEHQRSP